MSFGGMKGVAASRDNIIGLKVCRGDPQLCVLRSKSNRLESIRRRRIVPQKRWIDRTKPTRIWPCDDELSQIGRTWTSRTRHELALPASTQPFVEAPGNVPANVSRLGPSFGHPLEHVTTMPSAVCDCKMTNVHGKWTCWSKPDQATA